MRNRMGRALVAVVVAGMAGALLTVPALAGPSDRVAGLSDGAAVGRAAPTAYKQSRTIGRRFVEADQSVTAGQTYDVTVKADQTRNLRGRQRIGITWTGAQPSGGRASDPYGESGMAQEYPVVIMQCRGTDDPSLPLAKQVRPETCWTSSVMQRSQISQSETRSTWRVDADANEEARRPVGGAAAMPATTPTLAPGKCNVPADYLSENYGRIFSARLTPFVPRKGKPYFACDSANMPPEAAVDAAFPPAEIAAFTDENGSGEVQFEVRSDVENESLGCNEKVACSIVVIPIVGLSCAAPQEPASLRDESCRLGGRHLPGSSNSTGLEVDQAVSPELWWSASNWKHRFSIPITFGLPPDTCDILDPRAPTAFAGSELLAQAALQWSPAYCLDKKRFKFQHNQMSDQAAWNLLERGQSKAALVSSRHERTGPDPIGYAPTAVSGFSIGYVVDRPDNKGEFTRLRLTPRLVAKLLTQSYLGSDLGRGHPGIKDNPLSLLSDRDFTKLNPGLSTIDREAAATLLSLSNSSDVIWQLTDYIAQDPAAVDFINGKADPWGMKVNPAYRKVTVPTAEWPLLDTYEPKTEDKCRQANRGVYFTQLAAPVTALRKVAEALLDGHPNVQTRCEYDLASGLFKTGRIDRQSYGARFMLGVVSLGDAERYGLRSAALQTKPGRYVAPSNASLGAAVALAEQEKPREPFLLDQGDVRRNGRAYPGTMVVYTAAKTRNLPKADAAKVAQFMTVASTEGQRQGSGNGELPDGFLPIKASGVTKKLRVAAVDVAAAVAAQRPAKAKPTETPSAAPTTAAPVTEDPSAPSAPDAVAPAAAPSAAPSTPAPSQAPVAVQMGETSAVSSDVAGRLLPGLLLVALIGLVVSTGTRVYVATRRRR